MPLEVILGADGIPVQTRSQHETGHCPSRENRIYNKGVRDESEYSLRGTAYHECIARYIRLLMNGHVPMDFEEANVAFEAGIRATKCPPQLVAEVREIFDREVQHFELDLDAFLEVEEHRIGRAHDGMEFWFRADLVYGHVPIQEIEIIDHKTFYSAMTDAQARDAYQSRYLIWCAMQLFPGWVTYRMTYRFPRLNKTASHVFYREDFDALDREVRAEEAARRQRYADNDWPEQPGDQCVFCSLSCSVMDDPDRANIRVNSPAAFARVAGWVVVNEMRRKAAMKQLKAYANANGPQNVNGEIFAFRPTTGKSYDAASVVDLVRASTEIAPVFTVSFSSLKNQLKIVPGLAADLEPLERRKDSARFAHKSLKADLRTKQDDDDEEGDE